MIEEILIGILGNGAYDILKKLINKYFSQEDDEIIQLFIASIEATSIQFFNTYGDKYGTIGSSFLSIQQNWEVLLRSIFYGAEELKGEDFVLSGLGINKGEVLIGARKFINILHDKMRENWKLDKVLTEKKHITETEKHIKETKEKLAVLENFITGLVTRNQPPNDKDTVKPSIKTDFGSQSIEYGKKYKMEFDNGASINYMLKEELIYVEYVFEDGATAYYEVDYSGSVRNAKFPYPLEQYHIDIPEDLLVDKKVINLTNGNIQETLTFRWGKHFTTVKDLQGHILKMNFHGEVEVDHRNKKIILKMD